MNDNITITRVYHPYWRWEDYKAGFYDSCSGKEKIVKIDKVISMFRSEQLTREYMNRVIEEWKYSCEHNLTNNTLNRIAYIGQAACCIYANIPSTVTMEAWSKLPKEIQDRSDSIAKQVIEKWKKQNRLIQLCLNID